MDEKIVGAAARAIYDAATSQPGDGIPADQRAAPESGFGFQASDDGGTILDGSYDLDAIARAAIAAHTAALAEAERRFRKAIEVLAAAPDQR